jgi:hypothetical protein
MATITADDIRVLARSEHADAVLAVIDGQAAVLPPGDAVTGIVLYTRPKLVAEYGEEITDIQAEVLAAGLTAEATTD